MIDRGRLRELNGTDLPLHVLEQDYVQALFLTELYQASEALVFKGGTFLKHAHGLDRFSEDIDFTRVEDTEIRRLLEETASALGRYGLPASVDQLERRPNTVSGRLRYQGPLYDGTDRSRGAIDVDVSTRDDLLREPEWRRLFFPYPEARAVTARSLTVEEAFAEKLRALSTRTRGRDLYDVWFLVQQGVAIVPELFDAKMTAVGESGRVVLSISESEWNRDLSVLVEHPPPYDEVVAAVMAAVNEAEIEFETV